jgi:thioredoxin 2
MPVKTSVVGCPACGRKNRVPGGAHGVPHCGRCRAPLPWIAEAGDESFTDVVDASTIPVLVDLWAPWCGPCRMVSPALERLAGQMAGRLKLVKVNVDEAPNVAGRFSVQGIPTLVLMHRGEERARQIGAAPESTLRTWIQQQLATVDGS